MRKKLKIDFINICKYLVVILLVVYVIILQLMQGGTNTPIETAEENVIKVTGTDGMKKGTTQDLKRYYGLNANDYRDVSFYFPDDVMGVNEVLLVRLADTDQKESVEEAARERLDGQLKSFEGYGAEQTKLIQSAVLESRGDYVFMVVSEKADEAQNAFRKSL